MTGAKRKRPAPPVPPAGQEIAPRGVLATDDGRLVVVSGSSRSGKTAYTERRTRTERRVIAWDPEAQWCELRGWRKATTRRQLADAAQSSGPLKVAYVPGPDLKAEFNFFCRAAFYAGRYVGPVVVIAEELADVSTPAKAPEQWGILCRRGLKRGISIYAISQRWAEADKTAFGNASEYVIFMQSSDDDARYLARKTRVPLEALQALQKLEFIRFVKGAAVPEQIARLKF